MSNSREKELVQSLKHVSMQRLRTLKMDMNRLARDSRIGNERAFWSLLEYHNIRLDDRTKHVLLREISDSRGVNVEVALKQLRRAQKKTGRDSVEVLQDKGITNKSTETSKTPRATLVSSSMPAAVPPLRNYKLDNFRSKALGLGKLRAALKKSSLSNQEKPKEVLEVSKQPATDPEHPDNKKSEKPSYNGITEESSVSQNHETVTAEKTDEEQKNDKAILSKDVTSDLPKNNKNETHQIINGSKEKQTKQDNPSQGVEEVATSGGFLELLLQQNATSEEETESTPRDEDSRKRKADAENVSADKDDHEKSTKPEDIQNIPSDGSLTIEKIQSLDIDPTCRSTYDEPDSNVQNEKNVKNKSITKNNSLASLPLDELPVILPTDKKEIAGNQESEDGNVQKETVNPMPKTDSVITQENPDLEADPNIHVFASSPENDKNKQSVVEMQSSDGLAENSFCETENSSQETNENDEVTETKSVAKESTTSALAPSDEAKNRVKDELVIKSEVVTEDALNATNETSSNLKQETKVKENANIPEKVEDKFKDSSEINAVSDSDAKPSANSESGISKFSKNQSEKQKPSKAPNHSIDNKSDGKKSSTNRESKKPKDMKKLDNKSNTLENLQQNTSGTIATSSNRSGKIKETNKPNADVNFNDSRTNALSKTDNITNLESATTCEKEKKIPPFEQLQRSKTVESLWEDKNLDSISVTTASSSDEEISSLDDILRGIGMGSEITEQFVFGEVALEMFAPHWMETKKKFLDEKNIPQIEVDWAYGCNTTHSQCLSATKTGELIYSSGCVIVVYNFIRKTQRHYLEHSALITSIASHPDEDIAASAQSEAIKTSTSAGKVEDFGKFSSAYGQIHVRVWNCVTMETIRVIGCGIIRNLIYKMQFLNALEYFLTIEYDEHSTMTLWDGGCRVYSRSAATVETKQSQNEVPKTNQQPKRKRFVPTLPRSNNRPQTSKTSTPRFRSEKPQVTKPLNGPKAVSGNLNGELEFVTVGKYHLSFWQVQDCEMDTDEASNGGLKIPQPELGDFGKKFFRAEFITSCQATNKFLDGCIITGDSNGTLLMWSEKSKEAVKGFPHAHECYIASLCVSETGYIFTAGAKDRLVKAFCFKKSKLECCGCQKIPAEVGSATCLIVLENNLFVATEKNWILLLNIDSNITSEVSSSTQTQQLFLPGVNAKSPSSKTLYHRASTPSLTVALENESPKNAKIQLSQEHGVFSEWIADEVARGLGGRKGGITCVCSLRPLKLKRRIKRASYCDSQQVSIPTPDEGAAIVRNQLAMSSGLRRSFNERNIKQNPPSKIVYAWKNKENSKDESAMKRLISSISSPHLWTDKRIMSREKAREEETLVATPPFALTNHVMKKQVYCDDPTRPSVIGDCFVTSSFDGVIMIYSSKEHKIIARCNLPDVDEVNSIDACSRRHLVVVGTKKGQVTVARIDANDFEIFPTIKCRCSGGGLPTINALRFSPSGRKLAISIGYDVIVHNVHSLHLSEQGRCIGHYSDTITGIDWSKRKYSGTYFLRTCATSPVPEVKTWHSETMVEVNGRDILTRVQWASSSCILDYPIKGIWNKFTSASDVTSCAVYATQSNQDTMAIQEEKKTSNSSYLSSSGGGESFVCIGDATGKLHTQLYPCLDWRECSENVFRAHSSPIRSLASLPSGFILSTSHNDSSLVQWSIKGK